jgi:hypothetical protein
MSHAVPSSNAYSNDSVLTTQHAALVISHQQSANTSQQQSKQLHRVQYASVVTLATPQAAFPDSPAKLCSTTSAAGQAAGIMLVSPAVACCSWLCWHDHAAAWDGSKRLTIDCCSTGPCTPTIVCFSTPPCKCNVTCNVCWAPMLLLTSAAWCPSNMTPVAEVVSTSSLVSCWEGSALGLSSQHTIACCH